MEALKIYPEIASWKVDLKGFARLSIRFDYGGNRVANEQLNITIPVSDWDPKLKLVKKSSSIAQYVNAIIEQKLHKHKTYFYKRWAAQLIVNRDIIKQYINNGSLEDFHQYAEWVITNKLLSDGRPFSEETKRRYRDEIKRMRQYRPVLLFNDITVKFLEEYKVWLQHDYKKKDNTKLQRNSIWKALSFIRMVYYVAIKEEVIPESNNPFKKFDCGKSEKNLTKIKYLELSQLEQIEHCLKSNKLPDMTIRIGWRFLSMCVSGLRISDAMSLNDASFNDAGDLEIIPYKTKRHGNKAIIPIISDRQKKYLQKTLTLPLPETTYKNFRTTFNNHLKVLAAAAGIEIQVTSHVGRHTMGSFLVDAGVEKRAAMAILGVKNEKVIETYLHLKESKLHSEAEKLNKIF